MKTLITGGLGFLGYHLAELLESKGHEVIIVDNLQSNVIDPEIASCRFEVFEKSIMDINFNHMQFDIIYHLASPVGPVGVLKYSGQLAEMILNDSNKIRDVCLAKGKPFIYISSSEIYGHCDQLDEDSQKVFPNCYTVRSEYGAAKMLAEISLVNKARVSDLRYQIIRPFNVAGPRQSPTGGFVLPRFIYQALNNNDITVYGTGLQKRAFTDVRDMVDAIYYLSINENYNNIWNVGNSVNEMTIGGIALKVIETLNEMGIKTSSNIINIDPKILHGDLFEEVTDKIPYAKKLYSNGWNPKYSFNDTIRDAILEIIERISHGKGRC